MTYLPSGNVCMGTYLDHPLESVNVPRRDTGATCRRTIWRGSSVDIVLHIAQPNCRTGLAKAAYFFFTCILRTVVPPSFESCELGFAWYVTRQIRTRVPRLCSVETCCSSYFNEGLQQGNTRLANSTSRRVEVSRASQWFWQDLLSMCISLTCECPTCCDTKIYGLVHHKACCKINPKTIFSNIEVKSIHNGFITCRLYAGFLVRFD